MSVTETTAPKEAKRTITKTAGNKKARAKSPKTTGTKSPASTKSPAGTKSPASTKSPAGKNQKLGKLGEDMACHYLRDNGVAILERNWRCKSGEADIIAEEGDTLVFIEVKARSEGFPGLPEYAVTKEKRTKYERIAICYLGKHQRPSGRVRFDVIAIQMTGEQQCLLRHHRDAFASDE